MSDNHLPEELATIILSNLPSKNVGQARMVSNTWNNITNSTQFEFLHLKQMKKDNNFVVLFDPDLSELFISYEVYQRGPDKYRRILYANDKPSLIVAHCSGLVLVSTLDDKLWLMNPITDEGREIPQTKISFPKESSHASVFFGLTFDDQNEEYKVVRVALFSNSSQTTEVKVFSVRSNTWKQVAGFPFDFPYARPGIFTRGSLHWQLSMVHNPPSIATFNTSTERYGLIYMPFEAQRYSFYIDIVALDENSLMIYEPVCRDVHSFLLYRGYEEEANWLHFRIRIQNINNQPTYSHLQPLFITKPDQKKIYFRKDPEGNYCFYDLIENVYGELAPDEETINGYRRIMCVDDSIITPSLL